MKYSLKSKILLLKTIILSTFNLFENLKSWEWFFRVGFNRKTTDDVQTSSIQFTSVVVTNLNSKFDIYLSV